MLRTALHLTPSPHAAASRWLHVHLRSRCSSVRRRAGASCSSEQGAPCEQQQQPTTAGGERRQAAAAPPDVCSERQQAAAIPPPPPPPPPPGPYELLLEGKRFTCTECGVCCQGSGEVWANDAELAAMARLLGLSGKQFLSKYTKQYSKKPGFRMLKTAANGDCVFLQGGTKCSIYGARPMQCSTYPWWPELMDPAAWVAEGAAVCEGIEHETALPVAAAEKAAVLAAATAYFTEQLVAAEAGRRSRKPQ